MNLNEVRTGIFSKPCNKKYLYGNTTVIAYCLGTGKKMTEMRVYLTINTVPKFN